MNTITTPSNMALKQQVPDIDESVAKDDVLYAGMISIHDVYLLHGSAENRSTKRTFTPLDEVSM